MSSPLNPSLGSRLVARLVARLISPLVTREPGFERDGVAGRPCASRAKRAKRAKRVKRALGALGALAVCAALGALAVCAALLGGPHAALEAAGPKGQPPLKLALHPRLDALTHEALLGRGADSPGLEAARDLILDWMRQDGLTPAGERGYLSAFEAVTASEPARGVSLTLAGRPLAHGLEFSVASISDAFSVESAQAVFVGYGLSLPQHGHDDYAGAQVSGKVVMALTSAPPALLARLGPEDHAMLSLESRAAIAAAAGAKALLVLHDPRGYDVNINRGASVDRLPQIRPRFPLTGLAVAHVSAKAAQAAFAAAGHDLAALQRELDEPNEPNEPSLAVRAASRPRPASRPTLQVSMELALKRQQQTLHNCVGRLDAADPERAAGPLYLTAHYDGLGLGYTGTSFEASPAQLHPGADDNASGVVIMLEVARQVRASGRALKRPVVVALLSGEELGLRGARAATRRFVREGALVLNADMLGRLRQRALWASARAADPSPASQALQALALAAADEQLTLRQQPMEASVSDHLAFDEAGFQVIHLTTGRHGDYHTAQDVAARLDRQGMEDITRALVATVLALAAEPR